MTTEQAPYPRLPPYPKAPSYPDAYGPPPLPVPNSPPPPFQDSVITDQPTPIILVQYGPHPTVACCPNCNEQTMTTINHVNGTLTWVLCGVIALLGGILGCCVIPFCVNSCKDVVHTCPRCGTTIGVFKRL
ncbi:Lipopolysaccharide induced TNF alpha factor [Fasciola hepatica]|uniref:Lipopolysaccharide induced TNF alpha factor n=1 Tax=Fasciola hepatica TaxID=6192 RepID=A0A4E0RI91_FASHE|nr:Lipopolysaccharide induced TNF alpha factor [Fasciola hepatica]